MKNSRRRKISIVKIHLVDYCDTAVIKYDHPEAGWTAFIIKSLAEEGKEAAERGAGRNQKTNKELAIKGGVYYGIIRIIWRRK